MPAYSKIEEIERHVETLRNATDVGVIQSNLNEIVLCLKDIQLMHNNATNSISWTHLDKINSTSNKIQKRSAISVEAKNEIYTEINSFISDLKQNIMPLNKRYFHFLGSVFFVMIIPVIKFFLSYTQANKELNDGDVLNISNFDISLPLIIYSWIVAYTISSGMRKTWVFTFTLLSTTFLMLSNESNTNFNIIILMTLIVAILHTYDSWIRYVQNYEIFAYYK